MLSELCKELAVRCPTPLAANVAKHMSELSDVGAQLAAENCNLRHTVTRLQAVAEGAKRAHARAVEEAATLQRKLEALVNAATKGGSGHTAVAAAGLGLGAGRGVYASTAGIGVGAGAGAGARAAAATGAGGAGAGTAGGAGGDAAFGGSAGHVVSAGRHTGAPSGLGSEAGNGRSPATRSPSWKGRLRGSKRPRTRSGDEGGLGVGSGACLGLGLGSGGGKATAHTAAVEAGLLVGTSSGSCAAGVAVWEPTASADHGEERSRQHGLCASTGTCGV